MDKNAAEFDLAVEAAKENTNQYPTAAVAAVGAAAGAAAVAAGFAAKSFWAKAQEKEESAAAGTQFAEEYFSKL